MSTILDDLLALINEGKTRGITFSNPYDYLFSQENKVKLLSELVNYPTPEELQKTISEAEEDRDRFTFLIGKEYPEYKVESVLLQRTPTGNFDTLEDFAIALHTYMDIFMDTISKISSEKKQARKAFLEGAMKNLFKDSFEVKRYIFMYNPNIELTPLAENLRVKVTCKAYFGNDMILYNLIGEPMVAVMYLSEGKSYEELSKKFFNFAEEMFNDEDLQLYYEIY